VLADIASLRTSDSESVSWCRNSLYYSVPIIHIYLVGWFVPLFSYMRRESSPCPPLTLHLRLLSQPSLPVLHRPSRLQASQRHSGLLLQETQCSRLHSVFERQSNVCTPVEHRRNTNKKRHPSANKHTHDLPHSALSTDRNICSLPTLLVTSLR
jgi:hypothetical protein